MKSVVVVGAQWGDEGKGKVVDYLAGSFDYIARVAGGHNAGHTVIIGKDRYVLQLIPCGILRPKRQAVIGTGTVVDPAALVAEIATLSKAGIDVKGRLHVSNRAHLIFPYHRELDKAPEVFRKKAAQVVAEKNRLAKGAYGADIDFSHEVDETLKLGERIREYICDTAELLNRALDAGKSVLFEGAQGTMLDIDHGTYPYVTSSSATSGGAATGVGVPPTKIKHVLGISKAYTTRVGGGPFPTEMPDLDAKEVRERGKEFGAVTGRPRRCGWLDLQVLRYAKMINGVDSMVITKLDVFDTKREIQVCVGYKYKGTPLDEMPALAEEYEHVMPEYKTLPGWNETTYGLKDGAKLPRAAVDYLRFISDFLQVEIGMISTGPERDATIVPAGTLLARWL
ncbi:MAG: adenylosuccinate synthase [Acidobacteria bacterium]|nr:MAG: adenylosuccinate synthase [Acidobacteriota bacterium]